MKTITCRLNTGTALGILGLGAIGLGALGINSIKKPSETYFTACETFQGYQNIKEGSGVADRIYVLDSLPRNQRFQEPEASVLGRADILERDSLEIGKNYTFEIGKHALGTEKLIRAIPCDK